MLDEAALKLITGAYPLSPLASLSLSLMAGVLFHFLYTYIATAIAMAAMIARMTATIGRMMQRMQSSSSLLPEMAVFGERGKERGRKGEVREGTE